MARRAEVVVVTRHAALVALLVERGLVAGDVPVIAHATESDIRGKHVIGVLPMSLARHALSVTEIPLALEAADRGAELGIERLREIAGEAVTHVVVEASVYDADMSLYAEAIGCGGPPPARDWLRGGR